MSFILNIDTALETASVSLANNGRMLQSLVSESQKDHASWLHPAIKILLEKQGIGMDQLVAVGVSNGPGSYTGLRVGLSTAKGFCYALNIPLITIGTLKLMAFSARDEAEDLICPMIDARRMEVYTAIYTGEMAELIKPQ